MVSPASLGAEWVAMEALVVWALTYMAVAWVVSVTSMAVAVNMVVWAVMVAEWVSMAVLLVALAIWALVWAVSLAVNNNKWVIRLDNQCLVTTEEDRATKACLPFNVWQLDDEFYIMEDETIESSFDLSLMAEGFQEAIIGKAMIANEPVVAYDYDICVEILHSSGLSYTEAKMILGMVSRKADPTAGAPIFIKRAILSLDLSESYGNLH